MAHTASFRSPLLKAAFLLLLAGLFLWPLALHPNHIPMTPLPQVTDFTVAHLHFAQYIHDMWSAYGRPPLWNSSMLSGMPLAADPLSGYYYLPNWLTFLFPIPLAYNLLFVLHLAWTGLGLYRYLRAVGLRAVPALFGAAAWMGTPRLIAYVGSGQVSSVFALAWYPWLLLAVRQLVDSFSLRSAARAAGVLAVIILLDIRWGFLAGVLALSYLAAHLPYRKVSARQIGAALALFLAAVLVLTAVLTLPLAELMLLSDRASLTDGDRASFSLAGSNLLGVLAPQFGILYELLTYPGLVVLSLAGLGLRKRHWFWLALIAFGALFSLGENGPLFPLISSYVPGFNWMRVPSRLWFFVALGCAVLSAYGLDALMGGADRLHSGGRFRLISFAAGLFALILMIGAAVLFPPLPEGILAFGLILPLSLLLINGLLRARRPVWAYLLFLLMLADLLWVNASILHSVPLEPTPPAAAWLEAQPGLFRVYSPSYNIPSPHRLQTAEGINPTHLRDYRLFLAETSGIHTAGYSVSVPGVYLDPLSDPALFQSAAAMDYERLGRLNVQYIVTSFPLLTPAVLLHAAENAYLYANPAYRERAWVEGSGTVTITGWSPDRIDARVSAVERTLVVFSEIDYPGWRAAVDRQPVAIERVDNLLRGVSVPAGEHTVRLAYVPLPFYLGLLISSLGWIAYCLLWRDYAASLVARLRSALS